MRVAAPLDRPDNEQLIAIGCTTCGATCPHTDQTQPPLDRQRADIWWALHQMICPGPC